MHSFACSAFRRSIRLVPSAFRVGSFLADKRVLRNSVSDNSSGTGQAGRIRSRAFTRLFCNKSRALSSAIVSTALLVVPITTFLLFNEPPPYSWTRAPGAEERMQ